MRPDEAKRIVECGYDRIADAYLASKTNEAPDTFAPVDDLLALLPPGVPALDLGCGAGVPVTQRLAAKCDTTGVDISARQLDLARQHAPTAHFVQADMTAVEFPPESFGAVVSCFAIIHVPREEQPGLVGRIYSWLRPGGYFLATWATEAWEAIDDFRGADMWWSHYDPGSSLALLRAAGFAVVRDDTRTRNGETWRWVLAQRP